MHESNRSGGLQCRIWGAPHLLHMSWPSFIYRKRNQLKATLLFFSFYCSPLFIETHCLCVLRILLKSLLRIPFGVGDFYVWSSHHIKDCQSLKHLSHNVVAAISWSKLLQSFFWDSSAMSRQIAVRVYCRPLQGGLGIFLNRKRFVRCLQNRL